MGINVCEGVMVGGAAVSGGSMIGRFLPEQNGCK